MKEKTIAWVYPISLVLVVFLAVGITYKTLRPKAAKTASAAQANSEVRNALTAHQKAYQASFSTWTTFVAPDSPLDVPSFSTLGEHPKKKPGDAPLSIKMHDYVNRLTKIETATCPLDFQQAFLAHVQAWDRLTQISNQAPNAPNLLALAALGAFSLGAPVAAATAGHQAIVSAGSRDGRTQDAQDKVRETWYGVEQAALKYGIRIVPQ